MKKFNHAITTLLLIVIASILGIQLFIALAITMFFVGREHAQAEQRGISRYYENKRAIAPWYVGFERRSWDLDSFVIDLLLPILIVWSTCFLR